MRDSYIINGILCNSEIWYGLTKKQIEKLENVDKIYIRKLLNAHSKTPIEAHYIETGKMPIRFILQKRRLMYWYQIVANCEDDSLVRKVYNAQKVSPVSNNWVKDLNDDKTILVLILKMKKSKLIGSNVWSKLTHTFSQGLIMGI